MPRSRPEVSDGLLGIGAADGSTATGVPDPPRARGVANPLTLIGGSGPVAVGGMGNSGTIGTGANAAGPVTLAKLGLLDDLLPLHTGLSPQHESCECP